MRGMLRPPVVGLLLAIGVMFSSTAWADDTDSGQPSLQKPAAKKAAHSANVHNPFPRRGRPLPDDLFEGGTEWLNVPGPISLRDLRGKIVLVDFWTFCCINCMHILPDLKYLEQKYPRDLVVIGIHSAKFNNEKDSENIRRAIQRYDIEHPVINDSNMAIWRKTGVNSWPTLAVIDPEGRVIRGFSGEGHRRALDDIIGKLVAYHTATGTLDHSPLMLGFERRKLAPSPLKFPGKILADEAGGRLFIADSGNNRIVICSLAGKLLDVAGSGVIGAKNGSFAEAQFHHPQGMALSGRQLYVADTENHLIRVLDLDRKTVETLAGTGHQAEGRGAGGSLHETALNSPWDLAIVNHTLYVAMAGAHQIWSHTLGSGSIHPLAGTGQEDIQNGSRHAAAFAQPSGLASDGRTLYVADSEGSAIRSIPLDPSEQVTTVAGTYDLDSGRSLFEFGDVDDSGMNARFQHPLGLAYSAGRLFVADTYNHKIKTVDPKSRDAKTWLGSGKRGNSLDPAEFAEPGGLAVADGKLFIADTNNHVIKVADLNNRHVSVFEIEGLSPPRQLQTPDVAADDTADPVTHVASQKVGASGPLRLEFSFKLPEGYKLNPLAPASCRFTAQGGADLFAAGESISKRRSATVEEDKASVTVPLAGKTGKIDLVVALSFTYCREGVGGLCKLATRKWAVPIELSSDGKGEPIKLSADVREN